MKKFKNVTEKRICITGYPAIAPGEVYECLNAGDETQLAMAKGLEEVSELKENKKVEVEDQEEEEKPKKKKKILN